MKKMNFQSLLELNKQEIINNTDLMDKIEEKVELRIQNRDSDRKIVK